MSNPAAPFVGSTIAALSKQEYLDLLDRIFPESWLEPIREVGPGYEIFRAAAKVAERLGQAAEVLSVVAKAMTALDGSYATCDVRFRRQTFDAGAVTVKAGTVVSCSRSGRDFVLTKDVDFGAMALGPLTAKVRAIAKSYQWNVPGPSVARNGETLPGEIDTMKRVVMHPPYGDPSITVEQATDATGGVMGTLDAVGFDRGLPRLPGEDAVQYRIRLRHLSDTVTPDAIRRAVVDLFDRWGATAEVIETWEERYQTFWDGPMDDVGDYNAETFVYDDPRPADPFRNRWLSEEDMLGAFIVVVPNLGAIADNGFMLDDEAMNSYQHQAPDTGGTSAMAMLDGPLDAEEADQACLDGLDLPKRAVYRGLYDLLNKIRPAGVIFSIELKGQ